jgi:hypothetical protein
LMDGAAILDAVRQRADVVDTRTGATRPSS